MEVDGGLENVQSRSSEKTIDDWLQVTSERKTKWWYSAFHNITAMVGASVLSLPYAMSHLGWGPGVVILVLSWIITFFTQYVFGEKLGLKFHDLVCRDCKNIKLSYFILIFGSAHFFLSQLPNFNSIFGVSLAAAVMSLSYSTVAWGASAHRGKEPRVERVSSRNPLQQTNRNLHNQFKSVLRCHGKEQNCKHTKKAAAVFPEPEIGYIEIEKDLNSINGLSDQRDCMWLSSDYSCECLESGKEFCIFDGSRISPLEEASLLLDIPQEDSNEEELEEENIVIWLNNSVENDVKDYSIRSSESIDSSQERWLCSDSSVFLSSCSMLSLSANSCECLESGKEFCIFDGSRISPMEEASLLLDIPQEDSNEEELEEENIVIWLNNSVENDVKDYSISSSESIDSSQERWLCSDSSVFLSSCSMLSLSANSCECLESGKEFCIFDGSRISPLEEASLLLDIPQEDSHEEELEEENIVIWLNNSVENDVKDYSISSSESIDSSQERWLCSDSSVFLSSCSMLSLSANSCECLESGKEFCIFDGSRISPMEEASLLLDIPQEDSHEEELEEENIVIWLNNSVENDVKDYSISSSESIDSSQERWLCSDSSVFLSSCSMLSLSASSCECLESGKEFCIFDGSRISPMEEASLLLIPQEDSNEEELEEENIVIWLNNSVENDVKDYSISSSESIDSSQERWLCSDSSVFLSSCSMLSLSANSCECLESGKEFCIFDGSRISPMEEASLLLDIPQEDSNEEELEEENIVIWLNNSVENDVKDYSISSSESIDSSQERWLCSDSSVFLSSCSMLSLSANSCECLESGKEFCIFDGSRISPMEEASLLLDILQEDSNEEELEEENIVIWLNNSVENDVKDYSIRSSESIDSSQEGWLCSDSSVFLSSCTSLSACDEIPSRVQDFDKVVMLDLEVEDSELCSLLDLEVVDSELTWEREQGCDVFESNDFLSPSYKAGIRLPFGSSSSISSSKSSWQTEEANSFSEISDSDEPLFWPFDQSSYQHSEFKDFICISPRRDVKSTQHVDECCRHGLISV